MKDRSGKIILIAAVFIVNFLSLVYQVIWTRKIMVIFGSTALSVSTTLTVFLSGIALGGYLGGACIRRVRNGYRFLGVSLLLLGAYCAISLYLFGLMRYPFHYVAGLSAGPLAINLLKLLFCFIVLIFPTTVIGTIFPVATFLYSAGRSRLGSDAASVYFLDTLGASAGALLCGFFLVPVLGLGLSSFISASIYMLLGLALMFSRGGKREEGEAVAEGAASGEGQGDGENAALDPVRAAVLAALFFSGFAALTFEVVWSRYFHLLFGTSIYAFSLVVAAFLLGLASGSIAVKKPLERIKNPLLVFAYIEILIAAFSLLVIRTSPWIESLFFSMRDIGSFYSFEGVLFASAFMIMLIPSSLMGANFPLAIRIFSRTDSTRGRDAGLTFSVNTAGGIIGAFAAGFLILPAFGLEKTSFIASAMYFSIGALFLLLSARRLYAHLPAAAVIAAAFISAAYYYGGEPELNYSVYYNGIRSHRTLKEFLDFKERGTPLYSRHGYYGLVTVNYDPVTKRTFLLTNGKIEASTEIADIDMQMMIGHIPLFLHRAPEDVLNIGLGGGFTLGSVVSHPDVKRIDTVEIDPLVVEAAGKFFGPYNNNALSDPRVKVHIEDGRHFLETTSKRYDVIASVPSNIWVSGVSQLFTREFYRIADERLKEGGILAQWAPLHEMSGEDVKSILRTIKERFRHVAFWTDGADIIIIASQRLPEIEAKYVQALMDEPAISAEIKRITPGANAGMLTGYLRSPNVGFSEMDDFLKGYGTVNTDNLPYLEFKTARNIFDLAKSRPIE